jgi:hypothetical protein
MSISPSMKFISSIPKPSSMKEVVPAVPAAFFWHHLLHGGRFRYGRNELHGRRYGHDDCYPG